MIRIGNCEPKKSVDVNLFHVNLFYIFLAKKALITFEIRIIFLSFERSNKDVYLEKWIEGPFGVKSK